jgi:hypothetical protein
MIEIDSFGDFASRDGEKDCPLAIITCPSIVFQGDTCFDRIGCFNKDQLVFPNFL